MSKRLGFMAAVLSFGLSLSTLAQGTQGRALLIIADDGGLDAGSVRGVMQLTEQHLAQSGLQVVELPGGATPVAMDASVGEKSRAAGAQRLFVLHILKLGDKVILQFDERGLDGHSLLATASLSGPIEDADVTVPRLVKAVLNRQPVADTATMANLSGGETRDYKFKSGVNHFVLGLPIGLTGIGTRGAFGLSAGYLYENDTFGVGADFLFVLNSAIAAENLNFYGDYYFLRGSWTPYVGLGVGYMFVSGMNTDSQSSNGAGLFPEVGVEFLRLNHVRLRIAAQGLLPLYTNPNGTYPATAVLHASIAF